MKLPAPSHIIADLKAQSKKDALIELAGLFQDINQEILVQALLKRERLGTTAIVTGMSLPHAKIDTIDTILIAVGRSKTGVQWGARDGQSVQLIFLMLAPETASTSYLQTLAGLSRILKDNSNCNRLHTAKDKEEINRILQGCFLSV